MIVSEMIRQLRVGLGDEEEPYQVSTDQLFQILQNTYKDILRKSDNWRFLHQQGIMLTTELDIADYTLSTVDNARVYSLYAIADGLTVKHPMVLRDYSNWITKNVSGTETVSVPNELYLLPNGDWKVSPIPNGIWNIYADYWTKPVGFIDLTSEPIWDEEFHEIILLGAMRIVAAIKPDSVKSVYMLTQVNTFLPGLQRAFASKYLPQIKGARPLL